MEPVLILPKEVNKWTIRQKVWDYIESEDLANFPRPVHHRIPNFKKTSVSLSGTETLPSLDLLWDRTRRSIVYKPQTQRGVSVSHDPVTGSLDVLPWTTFGRYIRLPLLQEFRSSSVFKGAQGACGKMVGFEFFTKCTEVKVDPDKPLEGARLAALQAGKTLLVPTPRLRTGLFNKIVPPPRATKEDLRVCSTSQGVKQFSIPVGLDSKVHVDLVVVGSVAVSEKGYRIGKGEGYADMEYAMMVSMGAVNESTVVVTVVHDCQVVDIPDGLTESHDLTVDYILTPSRIIKTECKVPKPQGIIWSKLDAEMLEKIPILKKLRALEQKAGKDVTLRVSSGESGKTKQKPEPGINPKHHVRRDPEDCTLPVIDEADAKGERPQAPVKTLYLGGLPVGLRVSELKGFLRERDAVPVRLTWQGAQHRAFLEYADERDSDQALTSLQGLCINGHTLNVERAKSQKSSQRPGATKGLARTNPKEHLRVQHLPQPPSASVSIRRGWRKNPEMEIEG